MARKLSTIALAQRDNRNAVKAFRQLAHKLAKAHGMPRPIAEPLVSELLAVIGDGHNADHFKKDALDRFVGLLLDYCGEAAGKLVAHRRAVRTWGNYLRERAENPSGKRRARTADTIPHETTSLPDYNF